MNLGLALIKFLITTLFLLTSIEARENPFFPSDGEKDIIYTNKQSTLPPLKRATIALPTYARVIESVTINYKNLDGSQESKSVELDNTIDWHLPLFISQSYTKSDRKITAQHSQKKKLKKIASFKYITFLNSGKTLKLVTNDKTIRNFLLVKPHRIVLDFERDSSMKNYTKIVQNNAF